MHFIEVFLKKKDSLYSMANDILIGKVTLGNFFIFIFIFIITVVGGNLIYSLIRRFLDGRLSLRNSKLIARVAEYAIFIIGLYYGVRYVLLLDLNAFVASLGIIGIAIAFASQQIIQNFIAGILISVGRPIHLDDWVEVGESGICNIKDILLTRTVLRNRNGRLISIPNSVLVSSSIINYTQSGFVEISIALTIPADSDLDKIKKTIKTVVHEHPNILPNVSRKEKDIITKLLELPNIKVLFEDTLDMSKFEPRILISGISDSGVELSIRFWIREINKKDEIISEVLEKLYNIEKEVTHVKNPGVESKT
ncbi:Small-conductance mechanosensitive channel MscMJ [uncultured archaeon]|nr:Small-conductance mechanosensitive channel MscMJ [uncultured archaeon]